MKEASHAYKSQIAVHLRLCLQGAELIDMHRAVHGEGDQESVVVDREKTGDITLVGHPMLNPILKSSTWSCGPSPRGCTGDWRSPTHGWCYRERLANERKESIPEKMVEPSDETDS